MQSEGIRSFVALAVNTCVISSDPLQPTLRLNSPLEVCLRLLYRDVAQPLAPCGLCRQVIREFCALEMPILLVPAEHNSENIGDILETTVGGLLPHSFGPEALELPRGH